jgi:hypothetical protein
MELLQNADDNEYAEGVEPIFKVQLFAHAVLLLNNEIGWQADNIRAVSRLSSSTKKQKRGYIGQKGIGFKSVYQVSHQPEIHSNGEAAPPVALIWHACRGNFNFVNAM